MAELGEKWGVGENTHSPEDAAGLVKGKVVDVGQEGVLKDLAHYERGGLPLVLGDLVPCNTPVEHRMLCDKMGVKDLEEA